MKIARNNGKDPVEGKDRDKPGMARRTTPGGGIKLVPVAASPSGKPATQAGTSTNLGDVVLFYLSRWATPAAARQFAALYASSVLQRYTDARQTPRPEKPGQSGEISQTWNTSEGLISVETYGKLVLAMESFDNATVSALRDAALGQ